MHMQQITKKFLSLHFTHDTFGFTYDIIIIEKKLNPSKCRNGVNITPYSKSQSTRQRGEILEVFNIMSDTVS